MNRNRRSCVVCDHMGPDLPGLQSDLLDLHRALHELGRTLPFTPLLTHASARLSADVQRGTQPPTPEDQ